MPSMHRTALTRFTLCMALMLAASVGRAADPFPSKPIKFIVQFQPGGTSDVVGRLVGAQMADMLKQPVVVENRAGASGNIAADFVARSPADGYTVLVANNTIVTNPATQKVNYDVEKDFVPLVYVGTIPIVLAVNRSLGVSSTAELISLVKANPAKYAYSSCGAGTAQHLAGELFRKEADIDLVHIAYKGCNPAATDGVANQVPIMFNAISSIKPFAGADGKLKILASASASDTLKAQGVQSIASAAGIKDFDASVWFGFLVPANTPAPVAKTLTDAIVKAMATDEVRNKLALIDFEIQMKDKAAFQKQINSDLAKWTALARERKIEVTP